MPRYALLSALPLGLLFAGCPEEAKEKIEALEDARKETVEEYGGAPKKVLDDTAARVSGSMQRGLERLEDVSED